MDAPGGLSPAAAGEPAGWAVSIEEHSGWGDSREWRLAEVHRFTSRDEARAAAARMAREHRPPHPAAPRERLVLTRGPDDYLVEVAGFTRRFHVRLHVWEVVGRFDEA